MARIAVIGDGPAGLSAALFLARGGHDTVVFGDDASLVEYAELHNYLGVAGVLGSEFQDTARRQVADAGATFRDGTVVAAIEVGPAAIVVRSGDGGGDAGPGEDFDFAVVAGGKSSQALVAAAGGEVADGAVVVDGDARTSLDRVYAAGHLVRPERSQAIISAGLGAAAALDILARESGSDVHDWDSPS